MHTPQRVVLNPLELGLFIYCPIHLLLHIICLSYYVNFMASGKQSVHFTDVSPGHETAWQTANAQKTFAE